MPKASPATAHARQHKVLVFGLEGVSQFAFSSEAAFKDRGFAAENMLAQVKHLRQKG